MARLTEQTLEQVIEDALLDDPSTEGMPRFKARVKNVANAVRRFYSGPIKDKLPQIECYLEHSYGHCPICGARGTMRERGPSGNDICNNGHRYKSTTAIPCRLSWELRFKKVFGCAPGRARPTALHCSECGDWLAEDKPGALCREETGRDCGGTYQ